MTNSYKKLEELDNNISTQVVFCRSIERYYIINQIKKLFGYMMVFIGIGFLSYGGLALITAGLIFEGFATMKTNQSFKDLKTADSRLIELQTERNRLWAELMSQRPPTP